MIKVCHKTKKGVRHAIARVGRAARAASRELRGKRTQLVPKRYPEPLFGSFPSSG